MADKNTQNQNTKVDLDQGEELYKGFGFGNIDTDVEVPSPDLSEPKLIKSEVEVYTNPKEDIIDQIIEYEKNESMVKTNPTTSSKTTTNQRPTNKEYCKSNPRYNKGGQYPYQQKPDYELAGVYFTNKYKTTNPLSLKNPLNQEGVINPLPIKNHYKYMKKTKKKQIPWKPIALGLAATIGAFKIITAITDDDDEGFIF